jgi:hypothetical protein
MNRPARLQDCRIKKFRDVLGRWEADELSMMDWRVARDVGAASFGDGTQASGPRIPAAR